MEVVDQIMSHLYSMVRQYNIEFEDITILMHPRYRYELLSSMGYYAMSLADQLHRDNKFRNCDVVITDQVDSFQCLVKPRALNKPIDYYIGWPQRPDEERCMDHVVDSLSYSLNEVKW